MTMESKVMEMKKSVPVPSAKESRIKWNSLFEFFGNVKEEFSKISWTSSDELRLYTKLVVGSTFIFGFGLYLTDLAIQSALHIVGALFHFIFG